VSLAQHLLDWPIVVARQVHAALFMPASDMHPEQFARGVPSVLQDLAPETLSRALDASQGRDVLHAFDGRQLGHRLALLPLAVIERLCLNLGLVLHAHTLRRIVVRTQLDQLSRAGLDAQCWSLVFASSPDAAPAVLADGPPMEDLSQWPAWLQTEGARALAALANTLPPALGQRLRWKLAAPGSAGDPPAKAALELAYSASVAAWCPDWDACLHEAVP
jgi:hypothetical protein